MPLTPLSDNPWFLSTGDINLDRAGLGDGLPPRPHETA